MRFRFVLLVLIAFTSSLAPSRAFADSAPGLVLTFQSSDTKQSDARVSRLVALGVPHDSPPTPFIARGPFQATFRGFLNLPMRDQYMFRASGRGDFELLLNGASVLKCAGEDLSTTTSALIKLKKGANELAAIYTAPSAGDATIRLSWAAKDRPFDPIPPAVLTHGDDPRLLQHTQVRQGRELFAERRCFRCHALPDPVQNGSMPEISMDAPNLDDAGSRLKPQWMARWIADPKSVRPNATMPRVFARDEAKEAVESVAADIAVYLATRKISAPQEDAPIDQSQANVIAGERLFLSLGCIACHTMPSATDDAARTSLRFVAAKFTSAGLNDYLKRPEAHYAWTRMPNFALSDDEAAKLAAFLVKTAPANPLQPLDLANADPERGKMFFELTGCMKCHAPDVKAVSRAQPVLELLKSDWSQGCMSADASQRGNAPDFGLAEAERTAIRAFAKSDWLSMTRAAPIEFAERQIRTANCIACHTRDSQPDAWSKLSPEIASLQEALPPEPETKAEQVRPLLTWTGEKLQTDWMAEFIAGKISYKPRRWLKARMPAFASRAKLIAQGLTLEHGLPFTDAPEPAIDESLAKIGRQLAGRNGGLSCNQCHAINRSPALVPFDSPSINFMYVNERLRKDYFHRWVRSPSRYMPGTKMPTYADGDGKTPLKNILDGDADRQFEAIWQYLRAGRDIAPPE